MLLCFLFRNYVDKHEASNVKRQKFCLNMTADKYLPEDYISDIRTPSSNIQYGAKFRFGR